MVKYFLFFLSFLSFNAFAQNSICTNQKPSYKFNATEQKISYHLNYTAREMANSGNTKYMRSGTFHKVGEFRGQVNAQLSTKNYTYTKNNRFLCNYISEVHVQLNFVPRIYVAKEIQQYACTYQRVVNHEYKHYVNFHNGALIMNQHLPRLARKYFDNINSYSNPQLAAKTQFENLQKELTTLLTNYTDPLDTAMDTESNYAYESKLCGDYERMLVSKALKQ